MESELILSRQLIGGGNREHVTRVEAAVWAKRKMAEEFVVEGYSDLVAGWIVDVKPGDVKLEIAAGSGEGGV